MIDSFVLWTPVLMLGVVALLGFVGCDYFYGVTSIPVVAPPSNLAATAGDSEIALSWDSSSDAASYVLQRGTIAGGPYPASVTVMAPTTSYTDAPLADGTSYFYVVKAQDSDGNLSDASNEATATPEAATNHPFVTAETPGTIRNDFTGLVGMVIRVGSDTLTINSLGRFFAPGNNGTHIMEVFDAAANAYVPNSQVVVNMINPVVSNFVFAALPASITLAANATYYVVSQEVSGGDNFYHIDTTVQTSTVAVITSGVFSDGSTNYSFSGGIDQSYGPVNFLY